MAIGHFRLGVLSSVWWHEYYELYEARATGTGTRIYTVVVAFVLSFGG